MPNKEFTPRELNDILRNEIAEDVAEIARLNARVNEGRRRLAARECPFLINQIVQKTVMEHRGKEIRSGGYRREAARVPVVRKWVVDKILPPRWGDTGYVMRGRRILKDGSTGEAEHEIDEGVELAPHGT
jgi:hypothetical protein